MGLYPIESIKIVQSCTVVVDERHVMFWWQQRPTHDQVRIRVGNRRNMAAFTTQVLALHRNSLKM
jgi:hypothetical protein